MSGPFSLSMPDKLLELIRTAAKETHLSQQDVIRQSVKLGLPKLREQLSPQTRLTNVDPLPRKVLVEIYSRPERDQRGIERLIAAQPKGVRD
jgi:hypothetical protein